ncbi:hypothetical protein P7K49_005503 [Saguinus oedipus]|uniref:Uncharacterized protein n=1 Tax=Saguinus oedipus TaxID=9490 RepID=A0ABQ9W293_SAGOE|nr:hypothetical protein P7K49_005503 [Saguinus oedipus]
MVRGYDPAANVKAQTALQETDMAMEETWGGAVGKGPSASPGTDFENKSAFGNAAGLLNKYPIPIDAVDKTRTLGEISHPNLDYSDTGKYFLSPKFSHIAAKCFEQLIDDQRLDKLLNVIAPLTISLPSGSSEGRKPQSTAQAKYARANDSPECAQAAAASVTDVTLARVWIHLENILSEHRKCTWSLNEPRLVLRN